MSTWSIRRIRSFRSQKEEDQSPVVPVIGLHDSYAANTRDIRSEPVAYHAVRMRFQAPVKAKVWW